MPKQKICSVEDVAQMAKVSTATVSRVLNKSANVRRATAERVLEAAKKLDYRPDRVARRMRVKTTDSLIIGLVITDIGNPFFSDLSRGVEDVAHRFKNAVMISNTDENPEKEKFYIDSMIAERVSGLIIAPTTGNIKYIQKLSENGFPMVCVDRKPQSLDIDSVLINNEKGAYAAVKRLLELGHKRIGIINGIKGLSTTNERYSGYKKAIKEANVPLAQELVVFENYKESGGQRGMHAFLSLEEPPTAVFATNNLMTLGCIEEIHRQKLTIPDDIALIGFDDMSWSLALNPPLTAVKQPGYELGVNAAELLIKRLNNPGYNTTNIVLNPELIVRESCGVPVFSSKEDA